MRLLGLAVGRAADSEVVSLVALGAGVFVASRLVRRGAEPQSWSPAMTVAFSVEVLAQAGFLAGWLSASGRPGKVEETTGVVVHATSSAICGTDPHMFDGRTGAAAGLVIGHEPLLEPRPHGCFAEEVTVPKGGVAGARSRSKCAGPAAATARLQIVIWVASN